MKTFKQFKENSSEYHNVYIGKNIDEESKTMYAAHDYYGSPKKMVLKRKSPSSSGGDGGDGNGGE